MLKVQLKLHKEGIPIRPVINNRTAPAYKLVKYMTKILDQHIALNNQYNIANSTNLANDLIKLEITDTHKLITFDIKDLYVNIPILETLNIAQKIMTKNKDPQKTQQIIKLLKVILEQNYFTFQQQIFQPTQGVAMGSPISGLIAELFLQQSEKIQKNTPKAYLGLQENNVLCEIRGRHLNHI
jgi:hypothetical protein